MKKLMTMISAVAVAFGLQADAPYPSGSHFNEENWLESDDAKMWTSLDGLSISTEEYKFDGGLPAQFKFTEPGNNLAFKRGLSDPTYRAIELKDGEPVRQTIGEGGVVVDTLIKFTPYDVDDQANIDNTHAKVAVWVKEIEDADGGASTYQLMVTAGKRDGIALNRKDYACVSKITDMDAWYRLTVKAIPDVTQGSLIPGFVVLINGETVTSGEVKKDLEGLTLSAEAAKWSVTGAIFPSLEISDQTLRQVGFAGQGWIDDLSITDQIPDFVETTPVFTITGGDHVESFRYNGQTWNKGEVALIVPTTSAASEVTDIFYEDGYFGDPTATVTKTENFANKVGNAQKLVATVTIDGQATPYASIDAAVAAINEATSDVTLKLGADVPGAVLDLSFENTEGATITLDLAGKTVARSIYAATKVVITDSVGTGTVDADVEGEKDMLEILGGKYLASEKNESLASKAKLPEGQTLVPAGNGYLVLGERGAEDGTEANPYTISTVADLQKLNEHKTGGKFFELKNDITLTAKWAGIGTYDNNTNADAFDGTFDGKGFAIRGVTFTANAEGQNNYRGFFNQINNATIKNLTIEGNGFGAELPSGEYGCALVVGCANNSTIENCVASGTIASGTHNVGGIAVRIKNTTIKGCTNEANITGSYTKVGGIAVLCQKSTASCLIENCRNEGTLTVAGNAETAGRDGLGGIIAYAGDENKLTLKGCSNTGALVTGEGAHPSAKVGQIVGWAYKAFTVEGTFTVRADIRSVGDNANPADGLNFATVADGVATLVADGAAVDGANLKVMAAGRTVTLGAIGESITLDTTLAPVTVTTTVENAEVKQEGNVYTVVQKKAWTDVTDETPMANIPGVSAEDAAKLEASNVKPSAIATWASNAAKGNVTVGDAINLDAFVMDAANAATQADLEAKAAAEITQAVLDAIVAAGTGADLSAIAAKYPNATVTVIEATELKSTETAKFFKLKFELKKNVAQ